MGALAPGGEQATVSLKAEDPMPVYVRYAHKAEKLTLDLGVARTKTEIATRIVTVKVLDKGTGTFTLTFHFYDGTELTLDNTELVNGDVLLWDIESLLLTNTAQAGLTLKLLVDIQLRGEGPVAPA